MASEDAPLSLTADEPDRNGYCWPEEQSRTVMKSLIAEFLSLAEVLQPVENAVDAGPDYTAISYQFNGNTVISKVKRVEGGMVFSFELGDKAVTNAYWLVCDENYAINPEESYYNTIGAGQPRSDLPPPEEAPLVLPGAKDLLSKRDGRYEDDWSEVVDDYSRITLGRTQELGCLIASITATIKG